MTTLKDLSDAATQGEWIARPWRDGGNHPGEVNIFDDVSRVCIAQDVRKEEAELICAAVNGLRDGTLVEAPVWHQIRISPRDGSRVLVRVQSNNGEVTHTAVMHQNEGYWYFSHDGVALAPWLWTPVAWMTLPTPPEGAE